jgi:Family of unknown function (DUF6527)
VSAPVPVRWVQSVHADDAQPGDAKWYVRENSPHRGGLAGLLFVCPCGCGDIGAVAIHRPAGESGPLWSWNGDRERPTLSPSILRTGGSGCTWHGFLTEGVFRSV